MSRIFLYAHGGSGNHGCEAIVRTTVSLLSPYSQEPITLISAQPEEDRAYGVDRECRVVRDTNAYPRLSWTFAKAYAAYLCRKDYIPLDKIPYKRAFDEMKRGDIALSIGGDNYCYVNYKKYTMFHDMAKQRGVTTVLWGCSVEPELLKDPQVAADIARYDLITARETLSYAALKKVNPHTLLVADSAFMLPAIQRELPAPLQHRELVGLNVSPMVSGRETNAGMTLANYDFLIRYLLENTAYGIALLPHVIWSDGDDRVLLKTLCEKYADSGRIACIADGNCMELKGDIARCRYFVGARTHATIAAYSSSVPTLVVGYSVKARGIADDIFGTHEGHVLPVQSLGREEELLEAFLQMQHNEEEIRRLQDGYNKRIDWSGVKESFSELLGKRAGTQ